MRPPACWRPAPRPSPARRPWWRSGATARRAGRRLRRSFEQASGIDVELRREGTLVIALTADDQARLFHHLEFQKKLDLPLQWISAAETRRREPHLAGKLAGAVFSPEDHQVDNRKLATALRIAAQAAGASIHEHHAGRHDLGHRKTRRRHRAGGWTASIAADTVVLAAGAWSRGIAAASPSWRRKRGRRCGRSRARCWRCGWIRRRRWSIT